MEQTPYTHEVRLNNALLCKGHDNCSLVFKNLSGENFITPSILKEQTHQQYLAEMEHLLDTKFNAGDVLTLSRVGEGKPERSHTFTLAQVLAPLRELGIK